MSFIIFCIMVGIQLFFSHAKMQSCTFKSFFYMLNQLWCYMSYFQQLFLCQSTQVFICP